MTATKLTIGIPTYNRAEWLKECMASVLSQSYSNFRLIVSDNASDDATPETVRSFGDDRVRYLVNERNIGPIANFNRVLSLAETEFVMILPDDDKLLPGHLKAAIDVLDRFERLGLVHTAFTFIDENSDPLQTVHPVATRDPVSILPRKRALEYMMMSSWGIASSSVVYRTAAIAAAGGLRQEEEPFSDRPLWMRIALNWDFGYVNQPLAALRTHAGSITRTGESGAEGRELIYHHSKTHFLRRTEFLDGAPLDAERVKRLRAMATLQLLIENAKGMSWGDVGAGLAKQVSAHPRLLLRAALWRLCATQLGARRLRSTLRRASRITGCNNACRPKLCSGLK